MALTIAAGAMLAACGGSGQAKTSTPAATPAAGGGATMSVSAQDFSFSPNQLQAKAGQSMKVEIKNDGKSTHSFTISELGVDQTLQPGQSATVEFTPKTAGSLTFYCRFHRSQGMTGTLTVTGSGGGAGSAPAETPPPATAPPATGGGAGYGY